MPGRDITFFDWTAPFHDRLTPAVDVGALDTGLGFADREVERGLDVGGGTGRAARALPSVDLTVVDPARGMLREARRRGVAGIGGDAARLPIRDGSMDAVVILDALHHVRDQGRALAEAQRVLRPGGVLVVREFDRSTLRGRGLVAFEHLVGMESRFFTPDGLAAAIDRTGLDPAVPERGFAYTVVGVKPHETSNP